MTPTPEEIVATLRSIEAGDARATSLDDMWSCLAYDEAGEWQGYGFGFTPADARAGAWINVFVGEDYPPEDVALHVPPGWTFEVLEPGNSPVFEYVGLPH
jgi:hypothetical protein